MNSHVFYFVCVGALACIVNVTAISQCSLKVPVPDVSYCDASGVLEESVDADIHEAKGRAQAVQEFQRDTFKSFNDQIAALLSDSSSTDVDLKDVEGEILTLKRFVSSVLSDSVNDELPAIADTRHRRAAPINSSQQLLNSAKASFQQELARITNKLASISNSVAKEVAQSSALHSKLLHDLLANQQTLTATEKRLKSLDTTIRNALKTAKPATSGVSLSAVRQQVTDLVINATVAEQINERQLDNIEKLDKQMEISVQRATTKITSLNTDLNDLDKRISNETQQVANLKGGERIYEDRIGTFLYNRTNDVANLKALQTTLQQDLRDAGQQAFNATLQLGSYELKLNSFRHNIDGVQSIVTFVQPIQQGQIADILRLKKTLADDIHVLQYAFGLRSTPP